MPANMKLCRPRKRTVYLLAVILAFAAGYERILWPCLREHLAIHRIEGIHGIARTENHAPLWLRPLIDDGLMRIFDRVDRVILYHEATDDAIGWLSSLRNLRALHLNSSKVTEVGLSRLSGLTQLEELHFNGTPVTDDSLVHLKGLKKLRILAFGWHSELTDAGIEHLTELTEIRSLNLKTTMVSDAGLVFLRKMTKLEVLDLNGTQVTDAGLVNLKDMTSLIALDLSNTEVTDAARILGGLPNLQKLDAPTNLYSATANRVGNKIIFLLRRKPPGVLDRQWHECILWAHYAKSYIFYSSELTDYQTLRNFERDLDARLAGDVDLETVRWIGDRLAQTGSFGEEFMIDWKMQLEQTLLVDSNDRDGDMVPAWIKYPAWPVGTKPWMTGMGSLYVTFFDEWWQQQPADVRKRVQSKYPPPSEWGPLPDLPGTTEGSCL